MSENKVCPTCGREERVWHKFPEEKPEKDGEYYGWLEGYFGEKRVVRLTWDGVTKSFCFKVGKVVPTHWMEFPDPPEGEP